MAKNKKEKKEAKGDARDLKSENNRLRIENELLRELLQLNSIDNMSGKKGRKVPRYAREID
jgi:regulator of replication initiation timing